MDYMRMKERNKKARKRNKANRREKGLPILVSHHRPSDYITANVCPRKGDDPYVVNRVKLDLEFFGDSKVILKSDQEPAIVKLKDAVRKAVDTDIGIEHSPVGESRSNGAVENAINGCRANTGQ